MGGLGETAFRHFVRAECKEHLLYSDSLDHTDTHVVVVITAGDPPLHLGRASSSDCVPLQCSFCEPFQNERIEASSSTTFVAHIGPSGDSRGYMAITGEETNPLISNSNQSLCCCYSQVEQDGVLHGTLMALSSLSWWSSEARPTPSLCMEEMTLPLQPGIIPSTSQTLPVEADCSMMLKKTR